MFPVFVCVQAQLFGTDSEILQTVYYEVLTLHMRPSREVAFKLEGPRAPLALRRPCGRCRALVMLMLVVVGTSSTSYRAHTWLVQLN